MVPEFSLTAAQKAKAEALFTRIDEALAAAGPHGFGARDLRELRAGLVDAVRGHDTYFDWFLADYECAIEGELRTVQYGIKRAAEAQQVAA